MRKTLLLVFIHGFKGGDDTFGGFPEHLRALLSHALPKIDVVAITYPKFETRGELKECVERFREWLQNKVIDLEVAHNAPSPMIDPSVHTVLIGHSMGGIVAAETLLLVANEHPIHPTSGQGADHSTTFASNTTLNSTTGTSHPALHPFTPSPPPPHVSMFPQITGLLAFDTPFLGLSPGVIAYGAEGHYKTASTAYNTFNELSSAFGWGGPKSPGASPSAQSLPKALPASTSGDAAASPRWQSWGKYAMFAGAAGAVAAGGAAALYSQRERISSGWGWVSGHLEFVGCLIKGDELRDRIERVGQLGKGQGAIGEDGVSDGETRFRGAYVLYTLLGRGAAPAGENTISASTSDGGRTFVKLPPDIAQKTIDSGPHDTKTGLEWSPTRNDKATDEISAHMGMFFPRENPGFYSLGERAKEIVTGWVHRNQKWYEDSSSPSSRDSHMAGEEGLDGPSGWSGPGTYGEVGDEGWEKPDYDAEDVRDKQRSKDNLNTTNSFDNRLPPDFLSDMPPEHNPATAPAPSSAREHEAEPVWIHAKDLDDADVWMREDDDHVNNETGDGGEKLENSIVVDKAT